MLDVLTAADVRRQDEEAAARGIAVASLMEQAGWAVARAARLLLGGTYGRRILIVCGKGNNAGDGLVAGRVLASFGAHVTAVLTTGEDLLSPLATANMQEFPGRIEHLDALPRELSRVDLVIDALFGVGLSRAPEGETTEVINECVHTHVPVLAVDVPSGVNADTGAVPGIAMRATKTVTFSGLKPGLLFMPGAGYAGEIDVADIGVPSGLGSAARALDVTSVREAFPRRAPGDHKRGVGTVMVVAGSRAMPGAAALTTAACVHTGAGLTILCAPEDVCRVVISRVPEVVTIPVPESSEGTLDPKALELIRPRLDEVHALAIGPGLSTHPAAAETVRALVAETDQPIVIDADGLNALAGATEILGRRRGPSILTPHAGELGRLVGRPSKELDANRLEAAREAARMLNSVVVFKGPGTVIAGREVFINTTGTSALAQGGTGDVLTGILGALAAQAACREDPVDDLLAALGVWLHGEAADRLAARLSPHPANASALVEELGPTIHEVAG
jgi:ADP-dependent NAD(P)H-hydrate dehydratase / NAD(P)H-hydrate epimerase